MKHESMKPFEMPSEAPTIPLTPEQVNLAEDIGNAIRAVDFTWARGLLLIGLDGLSPSQIARHGFISSMSSGLRGCLMQLGTGQDCFELLYRLLSDKELGLTPADLLTSTDLAGNRITMRPEELLEAKGTPWVADWVIGLGLHTSNTTIKVDDSRHAASGGLTSSTSMTPVESMVGSLIWSWDPEVPARARAAASLIEAGAPVAANKAVLNPIGFLLMRDKWAQKIEPVISDFLTRMAKGGYFDPNGPIYDPRDHLAVGNRYMAPTHPLAAALRDSNFAGAATLIRLGADLVAGLNSYHQTIARDADSDVIPVTTAESAQDDLLRVLAFRNASGPDVARVCEALFWVSMRSAESEITCEPTRKVGAMPNDSTPHDALAPIRRRPGV